MKKIFYLAFASVAILAGCTEFVHDEPFVPIEVSTPVISDTECDESTLSAKVSVSDKNTSFYTYAVIQGPAEAVDPENMLKNIYADYAEISGCVNAAETPEVEINLSDLEGGEDYTLYVVANSINGMVSKLGTFTFSLPEYNEPVLTLEAEATNNMVAFKMASTTKKVYYYADKTDDDISEVSDDELIGNAKAYIQAWADMDEISFGEEYVEYFAYLGDDELSFMNLKSNATYTAFGFYMDEEGNVLSEVFRESVTTAQTVWPTEKTGTYYYTTSPFAEDAYSGMDVNVDTVNGMITISDFGFDGEPLVCYFDEDGNIIVPNQVIGTDPLYGDIYVCEYQVAYEDPYASTSFYNSLDKTIYFSIVFYDAEGVWGRSKYTDAFCFDGSTAGITSASVKSMKANFSSRKAIEAGKRDKHIRTLHK